ncbi:TRAP transporter substrate-binding protein [Clostridium formicaceticum]|uniref:2,3-diketo-L-gulonate-binding periplasmic protein YiaO n=1 Tax=Clostridium formicaceticum TaxID=1497 RepID=A0AAC9RGG4_9CLOT|nr:TRAP transporter substrate-binding protein [Clostridium formicaceticum]AOY76074.1 C4-dicarboxylate ABC transporter [Clostridium formicaceticum]ARE86436.1 2,3-diketo-L-gulonate-binding periplasmic protein YiaO precursor [Clostridium formicaceticum]
MRKRKLATMLMCTVLVIGLLSGCTSNNQSNTGNSTDNAGGQAGSTDQIVLRLADTHNEGYVTVRADREFARLVEEKTNGRVKVEVYPGAQLGDEKATIEQAQFGAIDFVRTSISPLSEFNKDLGILMLPYLYRDVDHMFSVLDGEIGENFLASLQENNLLGLTWFDGGARNFYNTKQEIKTVDDLKGMKIRVQESKLMMDLVTALGAIPTPMPFGDVYSGLQTGVIDGAENNWPSYFSTSHYEVAKYYTVDEHTRAPEVILISKMTFDKLSSEDQEAIKEAAKEASLFQREEWAKEEAAAEAEVVAKGSVITRLESNQEFQDAVQSIYAEFGAGYEELIQRIIDTK